MKPLKQWMQRRLTPLLCAGLCLLAGLTTGCNGSNDSSLSDLSNLSTSQTTTTVTESTWLPADESLNLPHLGLGKTTPEMCKRAILQQGNRARLANVMKRAQQKKAITVGCIGGSITQGSSASSSNECYAYYAMSWWAKQFPNNPALNFVNAGIGATGSYIGVHRAATDLLAQKPDLVIVEFSVNDTDAKQNRITYDSLVRTILQAEEQPAVLLLFMCQENGTTLAKTHQEIGKAYDLPMISYQAAIEPEIAAGTFAWSDIAADNIHPNSAGHGIIGELLWNYYNSVYAQLDTIDTSDLSFSAPPVTDDRYQNAKLRNSKSITPSALSGFTAQTVMQQFPDNWKTTAADSSIQFTVEARNLGILYQRTIDGKSGQYDVLIDGQRVKTLDANFPGGWGNYAEATEVWTSDTSATHTVTIQCQAGCTAYQFTLLGLLVS